MTRNLAPTMAPGGKPTCGDEASEDSHEATDGGGVGAPRAAAGLASERIVRWSSASSDDPHVGQ
jgi:hypothetical protein